ncbi:hypothetical protein PTKIN_Ptkin04bG0017900 [Pterospermum kingtungense]
METQEESLGSNEIEKAKISLMRNLVEKQDPSSKEVETKLGSQRFGFSIRSGT